MLNLDVVNPKPNIPIHCVKTKFKLNRDRYTFLNRVRTLIEVFVELIGQHDGSGSKGKGGSLHFYSRCGVTQLLL